MTNKSLFEIQIQTDVITVSHLKKKIPSNSYSSLCTIERTQKFILLGFVSEKKKMGKLRLRESVQPTPLGSKS